MVPSWAAIQRYVSVAGRKCLHTMTTYSFQLVREIWARRNELHQEYLRAKQEDGTAWERMVKLEDVLVTHLLQMGPTFLPSGSYWEGSGSAAAKFTTFSAERKEVVDAKFYEKLAEQRKAALAHEMLEADKALKKHKKKRLPTTSSFDADIKTYQSRLDSAQKNLAELKRKRESELHTAERAWRRDVDLAQSRVASLHERFKEPVPEPEPRQPPAQLPQPEETLFEEEHAEADGEPDLVAMFEHPNYKERDQQGDLAIPLAKLMQEILENPLHRQALLDGTLLNDRAKRRRPSSRVIAKAGPSTLSGNEVIDLATIGRYRYRGKKAKKSAEFIESSQPEDDEQPAQDEQDEQDEQEGDGGEGEPAAKRRRVSNDKGKSRAM